MNEECEECGGCDGDHEDWCEATEQGLAVCHSEERDFFGDED